MTTLLDPIDIIKAQDNVLDAQERDEELIEAIIDTSEDSGYDTKETLAYFRNDLNRHGQPIRVYNITEGSRMYKYSKYLDTWFHSSETLKRIAKAKKRDKQDNTEDSPNASH